MFNAIFNNISAILRKTEYLKKTNVPQVTVKTLSHKVVMDTPVKDGNPTHKLEW